MYLFQDLLTSQDQIMVLVMVIVAEVLPLLAVLWARLPWLLFLQLVAIVPIPIAIMLGMENTVGVSVTKTTAAVMLVQLLYPGEVLLSMEM